MSNQCSRYQLNDLFQLERLERDYFRGESWDLGFPALYGGQVLGQSLSAAHQTVGNDMTVHSLHSYFVLPGDSQQSVMYEVEQIRDGTSFATRRVKAVQQGRTIFFLTASFQVLESGLEHQSATMPNVACADELESDFEFFERHLAEKIPNLEQFLAVHRPLEVRTVEGADVLFNSTPKPATRHIWIRSRDPLNEAQFSHRSALAYASDYHFLSTALQPHGVTISSRRLQMASIDHSLWFHANIDFNDWHLYCVESPLTTNSRGIVRGQIFNQKGALVASAMQEGLLRLRPDKH